MMTQAKGLTPPLPPQYVDYDVSFYRYNIVTPFLEFSTNVHKRFIELYGEHMAVAMTAWGDIREAHPRLYKLTTQARHDMRKAFINSVTYERKW